MLNSSASRLPSCATVFAGFVSVCSIACGSEGPTSSVTAGSGGSSAAGAAAGGSPAASGGGGSGNGASGNGGAPGGGWNAGVVGDLRDDPAFGVASECAPLRQGLITDFGAPEAADAGSSDAAAPPTGAVGFGSFPTTLAGGTFTYPSAAGDPYSVSSDVSTGEWHVSGSIGTYSGFGLYFTGCNRVDASDYAGISFTLHGNVAMGGSLTFVVSTSTDDISHLWLNEQPVPPSPPAASNSGRCVPALNEYDGSCAAPSFVAAVTDATTSVQVRWADFTGGRPQPSVDPAEITGIRWIFPAPPGAGTPTPTPYAADVYIDDLSFFEP